MSESCKLLDLPPVGEMDHSIGICYCQFCTCGHHKCPGDPMKSRSYLPSSLRSLYKNDFTKKSRIISEYSKLRPVPRDNALSSPHNRMDLKTINQQDFVRFDNTSKTPSAKFEKESHSGVLKFSGMSQYQSEFPNWGHYEFISMKSPRTMIANSSVKLDSTTTYKQNFGKNYSSQPNLSRRKVQISNPLTLGSTFFPQTTNEATYKAFQRHHFPERAENKAFGITPLVTVPDNFKSMYSSEFSPKGAPVVIQKKRDSILHPNNVSLNQ